MARIVPPGFGPPRAAVLVSGVAEIALGAGLLAPRTRRAAAAGAFALLVCVWPANWYMALRADLFGDLAPPAVLWARVPLQLALLAGAARIYREAQRS